VSRKLKPDDSIEIQLVESEELSVEDLESVADFIAHIAYNNFKKAQENAAELIESTLNKANKNARPTN